MLGVFCIKIVKLRGLFLLEETVSGHNFQISGLVEIEKFHIVGILVKIIS